MILRGDSSIITSVNDGARHFNSISNLNPMQTRIKSDVKVEAADGADWIQSAARINSRIAAVIQSDQDLRLSCVCFLSHSFEELNRSNNPLSFNETIELSTNWIIF